MTENNNIAVRVNHVSKSFKLPTESSSSLRTTLVNRFKGIKGYTEQKVLKDISFDVEKGDFFGIVGRNGSGKSTLLKIISQIYVPEKGKVDVNGKLVSFIELGVGFNPELTGRENVYLNGAMLGFSESEVDDMYQEIVDFAELHKFMNQKLKNYSSGMQVRLAFSVAIQAKSDILVLDEILAVGDEAFQRKSQEFFDEIRQDKDKTVILVTHDMNAIQRYCNKVVYIKDGYLDRAETIQDVTTHYSEDNLLANRDKVTQAASHKAIELSMIAKSPLVLDKPNQIFEFDVIYNINDESIKQEPNLYLAYALYDVGRGGIVFDSGSINVNGQNIFHASIPMTNFHNTNFRLTVSLRKDPKIKNEAHFDTEPLAYTSGDDDIYFKYFDVDDKYTYGLLKEL
ncbi:ABC-transporter (ATP-binding protein)-possibly involved in cell wall localization and side chain formation of rhamnose-glucose polysaccharide [Lactococcus piscium]|uniref:ABC transporter ATP-binding protein n=1 Tax=Pseudolactococcus carnosus TaxID=2749961 RepID=A0ABT0AV72_9LACT|nr:ABC transporter ATP-binding protein [Lactococcus carnosus]MCJ1990614.1 ABC transporter ATP-binding protein [Lactococcus carnosus]MCJ2000516.1 ABC transporter ATP-binding protein [Lactococcus carnosus]MCJ2002153.1 ABC transporter ATP-binding protein [Lactococcus carnosus]SOB48810.1 ABC-transporter (ATP-binding protein)-possibly involved in cell wall localization and side chain formation of rhamnose-glucose polysaccharide [Lactococcus piscium]